MRIGEEEEEPVALRLIVEESRILSGFQIGSRCLKGSNGFPNDGLNVRYGPAGLVGSS